MEEYQREIVAEYTQLDEWVEKMQELLIRWGMGELDFTPACPRELLERQNTVMIECLDILGKRAAIEGISLATDRKEST